MFYERLKNLCKDHNTTISRLLSELGYSTGSTGNWKRGQLPKGDVLAAIADYLGTSIDYLVFGNYRNDLTDDEQQLINLYRSVTDVARYKILCDFA